MLEKMDPNFSSETCFTCCKEPANFHKVSDSGDDSNTNILHIICQHFWFKEDDLQGAIVCESCWEKVDQFHQFYLDVKQFHEHREVAPLSMYIKQEEITIEETQLQENCTHISAENQKLFDIADCKLEIAEESGELSKKEEPAEVFPQPRKKRKSTKRLLNKRVTRTEAYKCEICSKSFKFKNGYVRHKERNHTAEDQLLFKCNRCPESFVKEGLLKSHLGEHEALENKTAKCGFCAKCFRTKSILNKHVKVVHKKTMDFKCEVCSKEFYRRSMFLAHQQTHELTAEQLKEQCPICNKWLKNHLNWLLHVKRHKQGECKCEVCGHVSSNMMSLKRHMKCMHASDKKKYVCELCDKEYSRAATLREHVACSHTREHLYQCQYCERKFFSSTSMYSHRKKEHPEEWLEDLMSQYAKRNRSSVGGETVS